MNGHSIMEACFHSFPFVTFSPLHHALCTRGAERSWPRLPLLLWGLVTISRQFGGTSPGVTLSLGVTRCYSAGERLHLKMVSSATTVPVAPLSCPAV